MTVVSYLAWILLAFVLFGLWPVTLAIVTLDFGWWMLETDVILFYWLPIGASILLIIFSFFFESKSDERGRKQSDTEGC